MSDEFTEMPSSETSSEMPASFWRLLGKVCAAVVLISVIACVVLAAVRSIGLTKVTVTALDQKAEPRDHDLPLVKQKEALPDYELIVLLRDGQNVRLGTKPDTSAIDGLVWTLSEPVSIADVATVRLQEQDKIISDVLAEVHLDNDTVTEQNYRFDFTTERFLTIGVASFFGTPIGKAISMGFCIAVVTLILSVLRVDL